MVGLKKNFMQQKTLIIDEWKTIDYPKCDNNSAKIDIINYKKGIYLMENVKGYAFFEVENKIEVRVLKIKDKIVMVDDPLHWIGMKELAQHSTGKILVAGLGLGLIIHHLIKNKKVESIDVVEVNQDVINLVSPLLPKDKGIKIINGNFFKEPFRKREYDTIILDLWVGEYGHFEICGTKQKVPMLPYYYRVKFNNPNSKVFMWGIKDSEINPSYQLDN